MCADLIVPLIVQGLVMVGLVGATVAFVVSERASRALLRELREMQTRVLDHH